MLKGNTEPVRPSSKPAFSRVFEDYYYYHYTFGVLILILFSRYYTGSSRSNTCLSVVGKVCERVTRDGQKFEYFT